jgi:hypothetical protein
VVEVDGAAARFALAFDCHGADGAWGSVQFLVTMVIEGKREARGS